LKTSSLAILTAFLGILPFWLASCQEPDWPEGLPHGEIILPNIADPDTPGAYFDFSEGELVYGEEGRQRGDIYLETNFVAGNPALGVALHDQQPDSLLYDRIAPGWGSEQWRRPVNPDTPGRVPVYQGHNVWVITGEGNTGKLRILMAEANIDYTSFLRIKFEWIYQPDGSTELRPIAGAADESGSN